MAKHVRQAVTATQEWKNRMEAVKSKIPEEIGQQDIIERVIVLAPELDTLANATRWRNAWQMKVADPEITMAVERAVEQLEEAASAE
jgi:hypothetical protein